ncbi:threonylcarbamoyl-AMP synthase [Fervidicoccus fontis]|uniref:Threonylcarbamoyl-AMP synthase n=2 Tax=Fervidicoccus fontis TaxID=683846 RepID=I0A241_FERFK|nr:L-threonylcarbamoyladenylate synthase [Fervidicoccus fontis]AFH43048.1 Sua5/YciO/YrdC/YwlC family protein [Fervidicoccus fontis Kam940]MBE9391398.1 threonylcarbamoyl-AMP synthase [Fervidicoccus fontis]HEW63770.1 threonylcarbamoyl-AMP synthase [Fervidicoccus fontis]
MTIILKIDPSKIDAEKIKIASSIIKNGGLVAFPTETVYGLGANALNEHATRKIYQVKGRPSDNPIIVHISSIEMLEKIAVNVPEIAYKLIKKLWPGPLTLILKRSNAVPKLVTGGLDTVAVRMPAHPIAQNLIEQAELPIAAPSANISGKPSPTRAEHVIKDLYGKIEAIIDGGEVLYGVESTVINVLSEEPILLRPGAYSVEIIESIIDRKVKIPHFAKGIGEAEKAIAPGTRYRHYAPEAKLILIEPSTFTEDEIKKMISKIKDIANQYKNEVCIITSSENYYEYSRILDEKRLFVLGSRNNLFEIAKNVFDVLRKIDEYGCKVAISESFEERGLGLAVMNRLRKASSDIIKI